MTAIEFIAAAAALCCIGTVVAVRLLSMQHHRPECCGQRMVHHWSLDGRGYYTCPRCGRECDEG
jgi:tRNA(Ile2) C34 agmatinyltransferase TiaS